MMKDILVHLEGGPEDEARLGYAEALATAFQGHVTGLIANPLPDLPMMAPMDGGVGLAEVLSTMEEEAKRAGDELEARMNDRFARLGAPCEIRRMDDMSGQLPRRAASEARWADLFVAGRPYDENGESEASAIFESVLFESGRALLVVPPGREAPKSIRRILVCWRDTREAARALGEAGPLLAQAARIKVLVIDPPSLPDGAPGEPAADIARHLDRLGDGTVEIESVESEGRDVSEIMLEAAARLSADLIVMGGYGHSRTRQWMMGGATRDMLTSSDVPILIAH